MTLAELLEILSKASASSAMILIIWALMTEKLIPKSRLDDCLQSRERVIKQRDELLDDLQGELETHHGR